MIEIETINDALKERYISYLKRIPKARFGHDLEWAMALQATYGCSVEHLVALEDERVVGICPLFLCKPLFGGIHYQTSLFPSYFGPLYDSKNVLDAFLETIITKTSTVDYTEILTPEELLGIDPSKLPFLEYPDYTYHLHLENNIEANFDKLRLNFKRILRKSQNANEIETFVDIDGTFVDEFYRLYVDIYGHKHGFIPHVKKLFENIFKFYENGTARIYFAKINNHFVGSIFTFWIHNEIYYAWSAAERVYGHNIVHQLIWKIIQDGVAAGYPLFNMGESQIHNEGLNNFKKGWGTEVTKSCRYFIPGAETQPTVRLFERYAWMHDIIARLPSGIITNLLSPAIRYFL